MVKHFCMEDKDINLTLSFRSHASLMSPHTSSCNLISNQIPNCNLNNFYSWEELTLYNRGQGVGLNTYIYTYMQRILTQYYFQSTSVTMSRRLNVMGVRFKDH
jgi:hypothetical protein